MSILDKLREHSLIGWILQVVLAVLLMLPGYVLFPDSFWSGYFSFGGVLLIFNLLRIDERRHD